VRQRWIHLGRKREALQLNGRGKWHGLIPQCFQVWSMTSCHAALACCNIDITKLSQDSMSLFLCDSIHGNICWHSLFFWLQGRTVSFVPFSQHAALRLTYHEHHPRPARVTDLTWKKKYIIQLQQLCRHMLRPSQMSTYNFSSSSVRCYHPSWHLHISKGP